MGQVIHGSYSVNKTAQNVEHLQRDLSQSCKIDLAQKSITHTAFLKLLGLTNRNVTDDYNVNIFKIFKMSNFYHKYL